MKDGVIEPFDGDTSVFNIAVNTEKKEEEDTRVVV